MSDDTFRRVVFGSADDATMSELFGIDRTHSDRSEGLRDELAHLEVRAVHEKLSPKDRRRADALRKKLPTTPSAEVAQALRRLG